jgi:hypothetical protein
MQQLLRPAQSYNKNNWSWAVPTRDRFEATDASPLPWRHIKLALDDGQTTDERVDTAPFVAGDEDDRTPTGHTARALTPALRVDRTVIPSPFPSTVLLWLLSTKLFHNCSLDNHVYIICFLPDVTLKSSPHKIRNYPGSNCMILKIMYWQIISKLE